MSLAYPSDPAAALAAEPRLHAFVIGVSDYPHLNGHPNGGATLARDPLGLGQVSTPLPTAQAIVDWLTSRYCHDRCPLGSVEVLLSAEGHEAPTMENFKTAFRRWRKRCEANEENIAFFYFCGHGLNRGQQFLLPQDFGDPEQDPWENCINFDAMRLGMRSVKVQTQLYFIDACRDTPYGLLIPVHVSGYSPVCNLSIHDRVRCSAAYFATSPGAQAYGPSGGVSFFGRAVIECLDGVGSLNRGGRWEVDSYQLASALGQVMNHQQRSTEYPLSSHHDVSGMAMINLPATPKVSIALSCIVDRAVVRIQMRKGPHQLCSVDGQNKPLYGVVEGGLWEVEVTSKSWPPSRKRPPSMIVLMPPVFEGPLS